MHRTLLSAALFAAIAFSVSSAQAATFTYHGNLQDAGKPADGTYDLELTLYSSPEGGKVIAGPLVMYKVPVHEGTFSTEADFGLLTHVSGPSWLGVAVRNAGKGDFAALSARAPISAAETATNNSCPGSWSLDGNAGNPAGDYLGTADNQPLTFKVNGATAGQITPGKGAWFSQGISFFGSSADGANAFAMGAGTGAGGSGSFAGGFGAFANQDGSFMWGDSNAGSGGITSTTASNQYVIRAGGGVAINGAPKDSTTELTIFPSRLNGGNYSEIFLGNTGRTGGILVSAGDETSATSNDAAFYIDQYNGTTQTRRLQVGSSGGVGINTGPLSASTELTITGSSTAADTNTDLAMFPRGSSWGYDVNVQEADGSWNISRTNGLTYTNRLSITPTSVVVNGGIGMNTTPSTDGTFELTSSDQTNGRIIYHTTGGGSVQLIAQADHANGNQPEFVLYSVHSDKSFKTFLEFDGNGLATINGYSGPKTRALQVGRDTSTGNAAYLSNGGTWTNSSSRGFKDDFVNVDVLDVLAKVAAMPVQTWFYRNDHLEGRHMGPVAEDFAAMFALGNDNTHIGTVDESGVALAAIKGLNQKLESENAALQRKLDEVIARLSKLENQHGE